jgi:hypothetical protein
MFSMWLNVSGETMAEKIRCHDRNAGREAQGRKRPLWRYARRIDLR